MKRKIAYYYDYWLVFLVASLIVIGFLLLASASMGVSGNWHHNSFHFLARQGIYILVSITAALLAFQVSLATWYEISGQLLMASIVLLTLILIPGVGKEVNGSTRWLNLGVGLLQVSEFAKFALVIYLASYLSRRQNEVRSEAKGFVKPLVLVGIISFLLMLEPDFGATVVIVMTMLALMFLAGSQLSGFIALLLLLTVILTVLATIAPYRVARLVSFLNPWERPFDSGYQLVQSLLAFGRGGVFGVGFGNSIQKLFYLPEAHTDFLFAILAEEFGIFGQLVIIGLFGLLVIRIFYFGYLAAVKKNWFAAYLAYGFGLLISLQTVVNLGVNLGLLPTKGLTLPFMSYGGSNMLFNCVSVAVLLRIHHEVKLTADQGGAYDLSCSKYF